MNPPKSIYHDLPEFQGSVVKEEHIEYGFIGTLQKLKYEYRPDITNRATLEANFAKLTDMATEIQPRLLKRGEQPAQL